MTQTSHQEAADPHSRIWGLTPLYNTGVRLKALTNWSYSSLACFRCVLVCPTEDARKRWKEGGAEEMLGQERVEGAAPSTLQSFYYSPTADLTYQSHYGGFMCCTFSGRTSWAACGDGETQWGRQQVRLPSVCYTLGNRNTLELFYNKQIWRLIIYYSQLWNSVNSKGLWVVLSVYNPPYEQ